MQMEAVVENGRDLTKIQSNCYHKPLSYEIAALYAIADKELGR